MKLNILTTTNILLTFDNTEAGGLYFDEDEGVYKIVNLEGRLVGHVSPSALIYTKEVSE